MKIKRPDVYGWSVDYFNKWFDEHVEPINKMLSEAVTVYGESENAEKPYTYDKYAEHYSTHKALLINIQPIKKETAEDVLREWVTSLENGHNHDAAYFARKARAVLDE